MSHEKTISVGLDDRQFVIPTEGYNSPEDAIQALVAGKLQPFGIFPTVEEADQYTAMRSKSMGGLWDDKSGDMPTVADLVSGSTGPNVAGAMPPAAPQTSSFGSNFGAALTGLGNVLSSTAAGARGDFDYMRRVRESAQQKEQQKQQQDIQKLTLFPNVMKMLEHIQDKIEPENQADAIKNISPIISQVYPEMTEKAMQNLVGGGGGKIADLIAAIPIVAQIIPQRQQLALAKMFIEDPQKARTLISSAALSAGLQGMEKGSALPGVESALFNTADRKEYNERSGALAVAMLVRGIQDPEIGPKIAGKGRAELLQMAPGLAHANDDQISQLIDAGFTKVKTKGIIEAEVKGTIESAATKAADVRAEKSRDAADDRLDKTIAAADRRLAISQAGIECRLEKILGAALQRPLERADREAIAAMEENLNVARKLTTEFTDAERNKYVGFLNNPAQRVAQLAKNDPKFAAFQTLTNEVKGFAFAEGGKQLTETEKRITWGHLPVGTEFSVADYNSNLKRTLERTESLIKRRVELATTPRNRITTPAATGGSPTSPPAGGPAVGTVMQGYRFKGGNPADKANWEQVK